MIELSHLSDRLQHDPTVVVAFCRIEERNFLLAPEDLQRDSAVVHAICEAYPFAIRFMPPCNARSELESSVPFIVRLAKENPHNVTKEFFTGLPTFVREDREVSLAVASNSAHPLRLKPVHQRWSGCVDFWCDVLRRAESNLDFCVERNIPEDMWDNPKILNTILRHPKIDDMGDCGRSTSRHLFEALLRRVCDRESLRECVWYAKAVERCWDPNRWRQIPKALWDDKEQCLELLSWIPSLYGCLSNRLKSDPDVVAALMAANPKKYRWWGKLLELIPFEVQLQNPALVLRVVQRYRDLRNADVYISDWVLSSDAVAPDLWRDRENALALFRCGVHAPKNGLEQFATDREMWLEVAQVSNGFLFESECPASLRSDPQFMHQAVRANPEICLRCLTGDPPADLDLILAACATSLNFADKVVYRVQCDYSFDGQNLYPELKVYLCREVRDRASRYLSFSFFLSLQPSLHSPLGLLNQGPDTAQAYRSLLANYAGVPVDDEQLTVELSGLKRLCVALARRGY